MSEITTSILSVERTVAATAAQAFAAWTTPSLVKHWWGGWKPGTAPEMQIEAKVGAAWRFAMSFGEAVQWVSGEVTAVEVPGRLEYTFVWEGADDPASPVIVTFEDKDGACEVKLVHDISAGGNACEEGWGWSLDCLVAFFGDQGS